MEVQAEARITFQSAAEAATALQALAPDDPGDLGLKVEGRTLVLAAEGATTMGVLRTLDDALGCLRATGLP